MDHAIEELVRQARFGLALTTVDWEIILGDAVDLGDINILLTAASKLRYTSPRAALENLLHAAIHRGNCSLALTACKELNRKLDEKETKILLEAAVLFGNVQEIFNTYEINAGAIFPIFQTSSAIAVCRSMCRKHNLSTPNKLSLKTWPLAYTRAATRFEFIALEKIDLVSPVEGMFFIFTEKTMDKIIGALVSDNLINAECAKALLAYPTAN